MFLWLVFLKMQKNLLVIKNAILAVFGSYWNNYFCVFSKILTKITFMCLLFLKLKQKKKGYNFSLRFLFQNSKMAFFGGQPIFFLLIFFSLIFYSYLTFGYLTCSDRWNKISTHHPTLEVKQLMADYPSVVNSRKKLPVRMKLSNRNF